MKERPLICNAPMVRALLDGTKGQTRRVCKPAASLSYVVEVPDPMERGQVYNGSHFGDEEGAVRFVSPYGGIGDRLWVRETHAKIIGQSGGWIETDYRATYTHGDRLGDKLGLRKKWTPAIHMPRAASRIDLEITGVRVERLQDISEADAVAEGIEKTSAGFWSLYGQADTDGTYSPRASYRALWESINGAGSWEANPWVWVVEFRRIRP